MSTPHPLAAYGWDERVAALASGFDPALRPARVARVDRGRLTAVSALGQEHLPLRGLHVTTGDWVMVSPARPPEVGAVLDRWSAIERHVAGRTAATQLLAANVDVGLVVVGLDRPPNLSRLERLLTVVWSSGAMPVVVLTKADMAPDVPTLLARIERAAVGVVVVVTSSHTGEGMERLRGIVAPGRTAVLLGVSGAGKSSLANALAGEPLQAVGHVRAGDRKGRHTTRARELVPLPGAGVLLDTPGLRSVGLAGGQGDGLDATFADIAALAASCRFTDCRHRTEPGCAVRAAVAGGRLDPGRLASYEALDREVAAAARRADVRAQREAARTSGRQHKQIKDHLRRNRRQR